MAARNSRTALITGAASGIGAAFARRLAAGGYNLVLVARREERLTSLATALRREFQVGAEVLPADLSTDDGRALVEKRIAALHDLEILVNDAGFGMPGRFTAVPLATELAMIQLHVVASMRLSRAALPAMLARRRGAIINLSSIGAFLPRPGDATYCATKAYLVAFSRALRGELRGSGVVVQALCPGFTYSEFYARSEYAGYRLHSSIPRALWTTSDEVVAVSLKALRSGDAVCVPGLGNRLLVALARAGLCDFLLKALERRLQPNAEEVAGACRQQALSRS